MTSVLPPRSSRSPRAVPLYVGGAGLSLLGNSAIGIVLPWLVIATTGELSTTALVATVAGLAISVRPPPWLRWGSWTRPSASAWSGSSCSAPPWRDMWILACAVYGEELGAWAPDAEIFTDPAYARITATTLDLKDADPDDPRVAPVAAEAVAWMEKHADAFHELWRLDSYPDARRNEVLTDGWIDSPAWERISALVLAGLTERGWDTQTPETIAREARNRGGSAHPRPPGTQDEGE